MREVKDMFVITYELNGSVKEASYTNTNEFIAAQLKEVPDLPDYYHVIKAETNNKTIPLKDQTISGLFNYLNN